jgi:hypothetical protein
MSKLSRSTSRLAGYGRTGRIWLNKNVPVTFKGIKVRARLKTHEEKELRLRKQGYSYTEAHKVALKAEHKGLTQHQISVYNGILGAIAKHRPRRHEWRKKK